MPWKPRYASNLERENDSLCTTIICLRRELTNKEGHVGRLEVLLRERLTAIDELNAQVDQLRRQNNKPATQYRPKTLTHSMHQTRY